MGYLRKFPSFVDFSQIKNKKDIQNDNSNISEESQIPDDMMSKAQELYKDNLQNELLGKLKQVEPVKFEQIVLKLMEKMNYGVGSMTKMSHDGGVDGITNKYELGLEKIYLQAKRYSDNKVNEQEIQNLQVHLAVFRQEREYLSLFFLKESIQRLSFYLLILLQ